VSVTLLLTTTDCDKGVRDERWEIASRESASWTQVKVPRQSSCHSLSLIAQRFDQNQSCRPRAFKVIIGRHELLGR